MKYKSFTQRTGAWVKSHKFWTTIIVVVVLGGAYYWYHAAHNQAATPQYVLSIARVGTLKQTVTGTGQVSSSNQTDILSQGSGTILSINVKVGQKVAAGQLIASIDAKNAAISLQNAKLSLAKLTEPAKATDISNATNSLNKSYDDAFNAASTVYLDLPAIMSGMKSLLYDQTGFLSDQKSSYLNVSARDERQSAGLAYDAAVTQYASSLAEFKTVSRSSDQKTLDKMLSDTYLTIKETADAVSKTQNTITYLTTYQPDYDTKDAGTAAANVNSWASQANSDVASIVSAQNNISSTKNSLTTLQNGPDSLDIQSAQLSVEQAQQAYDNYFVRAPYDGIIGRIPVNVYGQAGGSTVIATIIGEQKVASISLNEVDAAKVKVGQTVMITFDAIDNLNATGTVSQVDQVGVVTQGVVSYAVKIVINTDDVRIKPGMSVNTTIITNQEDNVLLVPNSAVKTQGNRSYVQTFDRSVLSSLQANRPPANGGAGSSTRQSSRFASSTNQIASSTGNSTNANFGQYPTGGGQYFASSTRNFGSSSRAFTGGAGTAALTISSATPPTQTAVTVGDSDDTNTVILSGLTPGQLVVTRTISSSATQTSAPSLLSSLGARGAGGGGAAGGARPGGAAGGGALRTGN